MGVTAAIRDMIWFTSFPGCTPLMDWPYWPHLRVALAKALSFQAFFIFSRLQTPQRNLFLCLRRLRKNLELFFILQVIDYYSTLFQAKSAKFQGKEGCSKDFNIDSIPSFSLCFFGGVHRERGMNHSISPAIVVIGEILSLLFHEKARVGLDKRPKRKQQLCEHTVNGVGESGPMDVENALATHCSMLNELYAEGRAFIEWTLLSDLSGQNLLAPPNFKSMLLSLIISFGLSTYRGLVQS